MATVTSTTYSILRVAVLKNGRPQTTVEANGFASKRDAQEWLGLAQVFPRLRADERSVRFTILIQQGQEPNA